MTADDLDHELTTCRLLACSCPTCKATSAGSQHIGNHTICNIEWIVKKEFDQALAQMWETRGVSVAAFEQAIVLAAR